MKIYMFKNSDGFISLLTTVLLCLLILAVTTSLISLQILTLHKAEDSEQSQRAYYAAESGVEDAVAKIRSGVVFRGSDQTACTHNLNLLPTALGTTGWSCQTIRFSGSPTDKIQAPDTSYTIDPVGNTYNRIVLLWDQGARTDAAYYNPPGTGLSGGAAVWGIRALPLELTIVKYPLHNLTTKQIVTQNALILPEFIGSTPSIGYSDRNTQQVNAAGVPSGCSATNFAACGIDQRNPYRGACNLAGYFDIAGSGHYNCMITINVPTGNNYLFRLRSKIIGGVSTGLASGNGNFVMNFYNGASYVPVGNTSATIDVTGKAGNVYRRVIYKLPGNANNNLDFSLFSEVGLCQNYQIINAPTPHQNSTCSL